MIRLILGFIQESNLEIEPSRRKIPCHVSYYITSLQSRCRCPNLILKEKRKKRGYKPLSFTLLYYQHPEYLTSLQWENLVLNCQLGSMTFFSSTIQKLSSAVQALHTAKSWTLSMVRQAFVYKPTLFLFCDCRY